MGGHPPGYATVQFYDSHFSYRGSVYRLAVPQLEKISIHKNFKIFNCTNIEKKISTERRIFDEVIRRLIYKLICQTQIFVDNL